MAKPKNLKQAKDLDALMAAAYIQARRKKNPAMASTLSQQIVQEDMRSVIETLTAQGFTIHAAVKETKAPAQDNKTAG